MFCRRRLAPGIGSRAIAANLELLGSGIAAGIPVGKAIGEDLIEDALLHPRRWRVIGEKAEIGNVQRQLTHWAGSRQMPEAIVSFQDKTVVDDGLVDEKLALPPLYGRAESGALQWSKKLLPIGKNAQIDLAQGRLTARPQTHLDTLAQVGIEIGKVQGGSVVMDGCQPAWITTHGRSSFENGSKVVTYVRMHCRKHTRKALPERCRLRFAGGKRTGDGSRPIPGGRPEKCNTARRQRSRRPPAQSARPPQAAAPNGTHP